MMIEFEPDISLQDLEGLPEELINELTIGNKNIDFILLSIAYRVGGTISLDKLLVELFKNTGKIHTRVAITARLYRLTKKNKISSIPNRKGWYCLKQELNSDKI
jgi:hypothetical protein